MIDEQFRESCWSRWPQTDPGAYVCTSCGAMAFNPLGSDSNIPSVKTGSRGDASIEYEKWFFDGAFVVVPSQAVVAKWVESFNEFPIRQKPASFNLDSVMEKLTPKN